MPQPAPFAPPAWVRAALAVAGGLLVWLSFPDHDLHLAAIPGMALVGLALWDVRARTGALLGLLAGWAMFLPTLHWSGVFVGDMPWIALSTLEALYVAAFGAVMGWVQRPLVRRGAPVLAVLALPVGWVVQELLRGTTRAVPPIRGSAVVPRRTISALHSLSRPMPSTSTPPGALASIR